MIDFTVYVLNESEIFTRCLNGVIQSWTEFGCVGCNQFTTQFRIYQNSRFACSNQMVRKAIKYHSNVCHCSVTQIFSSNICSYRYYLFSFDLFCSQQVTYKQCFVTSIATLSKHRLLECSNTILNIFNQCYSEIRSTIRNRSIFHSFPSKFN